jgi:hypothetical protein
VTAKSVEDCFLAVDLRATGAVVVAGAIEEAETHEDVQEACRWALQWMVICAKAAK